MQKRNREITCGEARAKAVDQLLLVTTPDPAALDLDGPLPSESFPPRDPHQPGWMPISEAAYWIACEGGGKSFNLRDVEVWKGAVGKLLGQISAGTIAVTGRRQGQGVSVPIARTSFVGIGIDYPYAEPFIELLLSDAPHLRFYGIGGSDEQIWEMDLHDCLYGHRRFPEHSHLQVCHADLVKAFPFGGPIRSVAPNNKNETSLKAQVRKIYLRKWPDGKFVGRKKDRNELIREEFSAHPPSDRTIRRALERIG